MQRWLAVVWICAVAGSLAGCAMFRDGGPSPVEHWPLAPAAAPVTASVTVTGESFVNGSPSDSAAMIPKWRESILAECRGSGLFSSVADGGDADRRIEVHVVDRGEASMPLAFICGLTFLIVPCEATGQIAFETVVRDRSGATLGSYKKSESYSMWIEILLVFVMPFNYPGTEFNALFQDLTRATLADARAAGVF
jgi:hypothetical protein